MRAASGSVKVTDQGTLEDFVKETISKKVELVVTDDHGGYRGLPLIGYPHQAVAHSQGEYVELAQIPECEARMRAWLT